MSTLLVAQIILCIKMSHSYADNVNPQAVSITWFLFFNLCGFYNKYILWVFKPFQPKALLWSWTTFLNVFFFIQVSVSNESY